MLLLPDQAGEIHDLAGDTAYTLSEFAVELSRQAGRTVPYVNLGRADYRAALIGTGLPEPLADLLAEADSGATPGALFDEGRQLHALIGRPTTPLEISMRAALA